MPVFLRYILISFLTTIGFTLFIEVTQFELLGVFLIFLNAIFFLDSLGKQIDIISVILLFSTAQWILGPIIAYHGYDPFFRYTMSVPSDEYFSFILPAFIAFELGLLLFWKNSRADIHVIFESLIDWLKSRPFLIYLLLVVGSVSTMSLSLVPSTLRFVFFLLGGCLYIGVIVYFVSERPHRWTVLIGALALLIFQSIVTGLFHNMILWFLFIFIYIAFYFRTSLKINLTIVAGGLFALVIVQSIKGTYRSMVWDTGMMEGKTGVFLSLVEEQASNTEELTTGERISELNVRLNQGWIISRIMMNIPRYNDYLHGYTFSEAFNAALVPRFLSPKKRFGGSVYTFELLTGLNIDESTSMGPSLMGEAYGNYGPDWGILAMFFIGIILGASILLVNRVTLAYPILFIFIPIIFFQVVKAETDSITVLNHLVKSLILFIPLSIYLTRRFLKA